MNWRRILSVCHGLALVGAVVVALGRSVAVHAADQPSKLGIKPVGIEGSYFAVTMTAGERRELTVELGNFGDESVRARTYAADAYTIINGGFGAKLDGEPTSGPTRWMAYPADTLELQPRTGINRTFIVTVPAATPPGEYITSLAIQSADAESTTSSGSIALRQVVRQVIAVAITIPGPRVPQLEIGEVTYRTVAGQSLIAIAVKNTGNVRLKPTGEFVLHDASGAEVSRYPIAMDSVYAGTATFIEVPFVGRLTPGAYTVAVALADPTQHVQVAARPIAVTVPPAETDGPPQPIGVVPQPALINPVANGSPLRQPVLPVVLSGLCLLMAGALFGYYAYRQKRRKHTGES